MTHPLSGPGLPDEPVSQPGALDTEGPDATPDQAAYAVGLLATLRSDDGPIPDHVAARIDGVLAELRRSPIAATRDPADGATDGLGDEPGAQTALAPVTVLPTQRRTAGPSTRSFRWVAGAAAALVVVAGGAAVVRGGSGSGNVATSAGSSVSSPEADGSVSAAAPISKSGTAYRQDALESQASALVASPSTPDQVLQSVTPGAGVTPGPSGVRAETSLASGHYAGLLSAQSLAACIEQLTGSPGVTPIAVDQGTYEGKPANVVVLPAPDDPTRLEVWVVGPGCTKETAQLYEWRTIATPAPSP